jgi:hypothetical protein
VLRTRRIADGCNFLMLKKAKPVKIISGKNEVISRREEQIVGREK